MVKTVGGLLLLLGLAAVTLKFVIDYRVNSLLEQSIAYIPPYVDIHHSDASLGFDGSLTIPGIEITARGAFSEQLYIDAIIIKLPSFLSYLTLDENPLAGELPESMKITWQGIRSDELDLRSTSVLDTEVSCIQNNISQFGLDQLIVDFSASYQHYPDLAELEVEVVMSLRDQLTISSKAVVDNVLQMDAGAMRAFDDSAELEFELENQGLLDRLVKVCSPEGWESLHKEQLELLRTAFRAYRVQPSAQFEEALANFLQDPKTLSISMISGGGELLPSSDEEMMGLLFSNAATLTINHKAVYPLFEPLPESEQQSTWPGTSTVTRDRPVSEDVDEVVVVEPVPVAVAELASAVNRLVMIETDKRIYQGRLVKVSEYMAHIQVKGRGGYIEYSVRLDQINQAVKLPE